ncbi:MAG: response regulator [Planctomycetes bacterium]|jgi:CheY-like chemotaxis protein|nr:response regulator [Planctomycetota bacterium]
MNAIEGRRVLVVDDEPDVRRYLAAILEDAGFAVDTAADGDAALALVEKRAPDLISLDLVMPGKSGIRFLHALRRKKDWARIPVLIVTGHAKDDKGKRDLDDILAGKMISGPETYLEKPVSPESYVRAVSRQIGGPPAAGPDVPATTEADEIVNLLYDADDKTRAEVLNLLRQKKQRY